MVPLPGLALQVGHGSHALAVFHDVENAERVDIDDGNAALGFIVKNTADIGREKSDIHFS